MNKHLISPKKETQESRINIFDPALRSRKVKKLRLSKFVHAFIQPEIVALYHSLTHEVIYLDPLLYSSLTNGINLNKWSRTRKYQEVIRKLLYAGFLVSSQYSESAILQEISKKFLDQPAIGILYLLLTDYCNLRCRYCFIERTLSSNHTFSWMTPEIATEGIQFFAKVLKENPPQRSIRQPQIIFYGGEPLLNQKTFEASLSEISRLKTEKQLPANTKISVITNGTVLTQKILRLLKRYKVAVSISLDGPKAIHDANRIFRNYKGTFHRVINNLKLLQREGIEVSVSCTINFNNIDNLEKIYCWFIKLGIKTLGFNLLIDVPGNIQVDENYAKKATEKIIECFKIGRKKGIYEDRIMRKVKAFVERKLHLVDCGGCGNQIVITPDGRIGPCQAYLGRQEYFPGTVQNIQKFNVFEDPLFREWSQRSPFNIPFCSFCEALGLCGGGCPYNAQLKSGSIWEIDPHFCIHSKTILEWLIWDLYKQTREEVN